MSFRRKLTLFFVAIVMIPMIVVAILLVRVSEDAREGKADARLATGLETARALYENALAEAPAEARELARVAGAVLVRSPGDEEALQRLADLAAAGPDVVSVEITDPDGRVLVKAGPIAGFAAAEETITTPEGETVGAVRVTTLEADEFIARVRRLTALEAALAADRGVLESTLELGEVDLPDVADGEGINLTVPSSEEGEFRAATLDLEGAPPGAVVALLTPRESGFVASQPLVATLLLAFFAAAFLLIALLLRNMQSRVSVMLEAARRIGEGRFDRPVPVEGNDEMAGLAVELNRMSNRLRTQMRQLQRQQGELDESVKRIGEAFASGLDREALLEIVIETAVSACDAEVGRAVIHDGPGGPRTLSAGGSRGDLDGVLREADEMAYSSSGAAMAGDAERQAMGYAMVDGRDHRRVLCTMAVARTGRPFSAEEREVLRYLIGQTTISIENIGLHERVAEQAVTDELTGIANYRHFSDWITREIARVGRFGGELSLILMDLDDFKEINDTYGHQQGDRVLAEVGRVLRLESRGVDEAARYGGEEFVLALPETGPESALEVAERVRRRIERLSVPSETGGDPLRITVSLGVASLPVDADDAHSLLAAADSALYQAKADGKNQVASALALRTEDPQGNPEARRNSGTEISLPRARGGSLPGDGICNPSEAHGHPGRRDPRAPRAEAPTWRRSRRSRAPREGGVRRPRAARRPRVRRGGRRARGAAPRPTRVPEPLPVSEAPPPPAAPPGTPTTGSPPRTRPPSRPRPPRRLPPRPSRPAAEHAHLDDTADHPAPEPGSEEIVSEAPSAPGRSRSPRRRPRRPSRCRRSPSPWRRRSPRGGEPAGGGGAAGAPESGIFDAAEEFEFDELDLELDEEDDGTVGPQPAATEPAASEPPRRHRASRFPRARDGGAARALRGGRHRQPAAARAAPRRRRG